MLGLGIRTRVNEGVYCELSRSNDSSSLKDRAIAIANREIVARIRVKENQLLHAYFENYINNIKVLSLLFIKYQRNNNIYRVN